MFTILKGSSVIMVIGLLTFLLIKMFSVKVLVVLYITQVFFLLCYFLGLVVEDILD